VVLWLVTIPVVAVLALLWLGRPPETFTADVAESSVEPTDAGLVVADVRWTDEDGVRRVRSIHVASELVDSGSVTLTAEEGGEVRVVAPGDETGPSRTVLMVTALIGLAFAVVVLATVRGFGYVRGTGRYGEMDPDDVKESHAFYWRF
jgi:hypothetical protein